MTSQFKPSTRIPTGGQSPIKRVNWNLVNWTTEERTYGQGTEQQRTGVSIKLQFKINRVIESDEPYPLPVCEIVIPYTDPSRSQGGTRWEALSKSGRAVFGRPWDLDELKGKEQEWAQALAPLRQSLKEEDGSDKVDGNGRAVWGDQPSLCWQIVAVEGAGVTATGGGGNSAMVEDILDYVARQAEGLDTESLHIKLVGDSKVLQHQNLISEITNRQLVPKLITLGKVELGADGVHLHSLVPAAV